MKITQSMMQDVMASVLMDLVHVVLAHAPKCNSASCKSIALWENSNHVKMCDKHHEDYKKASPGVLVEPVLEQERLRKFTMFVKVYETLPDIPLDPSDPHESLDLINEALELRDERVGENQEDDVDEDYAEFLKRNPKTSKNDLN